MSLKARITEDMKNAMRSGEKDRLGLIRMLQAGIKQREVDERIELDDSQVLAVLPGRLLTAFFLKHLKRIGNFGDVVPFFFVRRIVDPFVDLLIRLSRPLPADLGVFLYRWHNRSPLMF
jgi:hypothetical protein